MQECDAYKNVLKQEGLKNTKHRNSILEIIEKSQQPVTAESIYMDLKSNNVSINISTVYRVLDTLVSKNIVVKSIMLSDSKAIYELNKQEHKHHVICSCCRKMFSVDGCPLEEYEKSLSEKLGFDVTGHKLEIFGYCSECKRVNEEEIKDIENPPYNSSL